jgi:glycosyltransferase involved in cell wall biosynthesis
MALEQIYRPVPSPTPRRNRIVVFTPFRDAGEFLARCMASLGEQDYGHFEVLCIDDASSDGSADAVPRDPRFRLFRNESRAGLAANLHRAISRECRPDDIVVCLDGDDWLACPDALSFINDFYDRHGCWLMYGQFQFADGSRGFSAPFASERDFRDLRQYFRASHIRTFRAGLFHCIARQDPNYDCLKDENGAWLKYAVDAALMHALLELAGFDKVRFNERVLYIYNDENPQNAHRAGRPEQEEWYSLLARRRPFARVDSYAPSAIPEVSYASR